MMNPRTFLELNLARVEGPPDAAAEAAAASRTESLRVTAGFQEMSERGLDALLIVSQPDPGIDFVDRHAPEAMRNAERLPGFRRVDIAGTDHTFTTIASQRQVELTTTDYLLRHLSPSPGSPGGRGLPSGFELAAVLADQIGQAANRGEVLGGNLVQLNATPNVLSIQMTSSSTPGGVDDPGQAGVGEQLELSIRRQLRLDVYLDQLFDTQIGSRFAPPRRSLFRQSARTRYYPLTARKRSSKIWRLSGASPVPIPPYLVHRRNGRNRWGASLDRRRRWNPGPVVVVTR